LVKGGDYQLNQVVGAEIVRAYGGDVRIVNSQEMTSTSHIINRIISRQANETDTEQVKEDKQHYG